MPVPLLIVAALTTAALAGCGDVSRLRPQTTAVRAGASGFAHPIPHEHALVPGSAPGAGNAANESGGGERSMRLHGPGISRARQTRV